MEETNLITNQFWSDNERFADITNVVLFNGKDFLKADKLITEDVATGTFIGRLRQRFAVQRYRDVIRKSTVGGNYVLIGIENQTDIHYAMPVRVMGYDFLGYDQQLKRIKKQHRIKKDLSSGAEYLSGISKEDKLKPISTIVLYYGMEPWDGPKKLSDMIDWSELPDSFKENVSDYSVKVVDLRRFSESENLKTDARILIGFLKNAENTTALRKYIEENAADFSDVQEDTYDMISVLTNSENIIKGKDDYINKEGGVDMCKALEDWKEEIIREGELEKTKVVVRNLLGRGMPDKDICALVVCDQELIDEIRKEL